MLLWCGADHNKRWVYNEVAFGLNEHGFDQLARAGLSGYFLTPGTYIFELFIGAYYHHGFGFGLGAGVGGGSTSACQSLLTLQLSVRQFADSTYNNPEHWNERVRSLIQRLPNDEHAAGGSMEAHGKMKRAPTSNERDMLMFIVRFHLHLPTHRLQPRFVHSNFLF